VTLKKELSNVGFFALLLAGMVYVGKRVDKGWGFLFRRGSDK